jgi:hypothetical protein
MAINQLILYKEIIAVCTEISSQHRNTFCGQKPNFYFLICNLVLHTADNLKETGREEDRKTAGEDR